MGLSRKASAELRTRPNGSGLLFNQPAAQGAIHQPEGFSTRRGRENSTSGSREGDRERHELARTGVACIRPATASAARSRFSDDQSIRHRQVGPCPPAGVTRSSGVSHEESTHGCRPRRPAPADAEARKSFRVGATSDYLLKNRVLGRESAWASCRRRSCLQTSGQMGMSAVAFAFGHGCGRHPNTPVCKRSLLSQSAPMFAGRFSASRSQSLIIPTETAQRSSATRSRVGSPSERHRRRPSIRRGFLAACHSPCRVLAPTTRPLSPGTSVTSTPR